MRRHARRYLLPGLGVLLAVVFLRASCAGTPRSPGELGVAQQSEICRQVEETAERALEQQGRDDAGAVSRQVGKQCREAPRTPVSATVTPVKASDGCLQQRPAEFPRIKPLRRTQALPPSPLPYFAERLSPLPADGEPTVAGVRLPRGSRCARHWASDEPVPDAAALASKLAGAFPRTGLWPVLWNAGSDDPDTILLPLRAPRAADRLDARAVLRKSLARLSGEMPALPRLAPGAGGAARPADPFGTFARLRLPDPGMPPEQWILLLVPVHRPADALIVAGASLTGFNSDQELTAVVRSWEERFGAVPVALEAGGLELAVGAPATGEEQARLLALEQYAFDPDDERVTFEDLPAVAQRLRSPEPDPEHARSSGLWGFGWPD